jgi:SAM-dependent methyltransferase
MNRPADFTCPNCGATGCAPRFGMEAWTFVQCRYCEAEMFWPIPAEADLALYYAGENAYTDTGAAAAERYLDDPGPWRDLARDFASRRAHLGMVPGARCVDIGCSYGLRSIELNNLGFESWGTEYSVPAVVFINGHGGLAWRGSVTDGDFPVEHIDFCYSSNALEHMANPYDVLRTLRGKLAPHGTLELDLPHWGSLVAQIPDRRWKWLVPRDHIHYFRATTLPGILRGLGFDIVSVATTADADEIDEVFEDFGVPAEARTAEAAAAVAAVLKNGRLGHQLNIVARVGGG